MKEHEITSSSGNVFADIGVTDPEVMQLKSQLASEILKRFRESGLTQIQYAERVGIAQPDLSDVVRGKLRKYSIERLVSFLKATGAEVRLEASLKSSTARVRPAQQPLDQRSSHIIEVGYYPQTGQVVEYADRANVSGPGQFIIVDSGSRLVGKHRYGGVRRRKAEQSGEPT